MDANNWVKVLAGLFLLTFMLWQVWQVHKIQKDLEASEREWHNKLSDMINPAVIEAEMERTATLREIRDANRSILPREDSGPSARIYRPKLRGQMPGSWRPRNPAVFHKIDQEDD